MANTKQQTKQEYEDWVDEDTQLAEDFTDKLNKLFYRMLKNPSDKEMDNFQTVRDALIVAFTGLSVICAPAFSIACMAKSLTKFS